MKCLLKDKAVLLNITGANILYFPLEISVKDHFHPDHLELEQVKLGQQEQV